MDLVKLAESGSLVELSCTDAQRLAQACRAASLDLFGLRMLPGSYGEDPDKPGDDPLRVETAFHFEALYLFFQTVAMIPDVLEQGPDGVQVMPPTQPARQPATRQGRGRRTPMDKPAPQTAPSGNPGELCRFAAPVASDAPAPLVSEGAAS